MRWHHVAVALGVVCLCLASEAMPLSDEVNEVNPKPKIRIDANLRRALLRALEELEQQDMDIIGGDAEEAVRNEYSDDDEDDSSSSSLKPPVTYDVHSFGAKDPVFNSSVILPTDGKITSVHYSEDLGLKTDSEKVRLKTFDVENAETLTTSASSSTDAGAFKPINVVDEDSLPAKTVKSRANTVSSINSIQSADKATTTTTKAAPPSTSPTPTVTTPIEEDEENAKADEVQFFSAPLVAAFTVHQDERGQPKRIEPIYKNLGQIAITTEQLEEIRLKQQREDVEKVRFQQEQERQYRNQVLLLEKQRELERQILELQQQTKHREDLIRQQQKLRDIQLQHERQLAVQLREQQPPFPAFQNNFLANPTPVRNSQQGTIVTLQPSISFSPNNNFAQDFNNPLGSGLTAQQPPSKPATNFLGAPNQFSGSFNAPSFTPPNPVRFQNFQTPFVTSTRPTRQEFAVGNFGLNEPNGATLLDASKSPASSPFLLPPTTHNARFQRTSDAQLKSLLYHSGLARGKTQEDLSIISKVLSLNHYDSPILTFAGSNPVEQKVRAPTAIKASETETKPDKSI